MLSCTEPNMVSKVIPNFSPSPTRNSLNPFFVGGSFLQTTLPPSFPAPSLNLHVQLRLYFSLIPILRHCRTIVKYSHHLYKGCQPPISVTLAGTTMSVSCPAYSVVACTLTTELHQLVILVKGEKKGAFLLMRRISRRLYSCTEEGDPEQPRVRG